MENKKSEKKNGKKIAIIVIIALLAAAVILCIALLPKNAAEPEESSVPTESAEPATPGSSSDKPTSGKPAESAKPEASANPAESAAPSQSGSTGNQPTNGNDGQNNDSEKHQHSWQPIYKTVHHDEKGHYETVVIQAAWDEEKLSYTDVCNVCGYKGSDVAEHIMFDHNGAGSYHNEGFPTGEYIHHDEVTEQQWVVDTPAYDEQVVVGYKCSC